MAILEETSNKSLTIAPSQFLALLSSHPANAEYITPCSPGLEAALRYLPLLVMDRNLVDAALNFFSAHLVPMVGAFLLHPKMPGPLRVLVLLLKEQVEDVVIVDLCPPPAVALAVPPDTVVLVLELEELKTLGTVEEPRRYYEWMKSTFDFDSKGQLTQAEFFQLYNGTFAPFAEATQPLAPVNVTKYFNVVCPPAQTQPPPGPPQKFVVRVVSRKQAKPPNQGTRDWDFFNVSGRAVQKDTCNRSTSARTC